jgi:CubicO group peptidase (beta-lactamase class C family)
MRRIQAAALLPTLGAVVGAVKEPPFTFPRSAPQAQGISSSAILAFAEEAEQKLHALHSIMIVRHGQVEAEGWWGPYAAEEPRMLFSLSKSFTSTAVGLAIADGKLKVDEPVLGFFPDEAPAQPSANLAVARYPTPFVTTYMLRFAGDQLFLTAEQNVPANAKPVEIVGRLATSAAR